MSVLTDLSQRIQSLLADRQQHASAIAAIDQVMERVSAALGKTTAKRKSPKPASPAVTKPAKRRRRTFAQNADQFVLAFVKTKKNPTTKQVNQHWKKQGRSHTADNTLTKLVKEKKLKRTPIVGGRGSQYSVA
jgi:hypothetical protein